ncbi:MAG: hypothetical protein QE509_03285, partial [Gammaproteobacteria bacterium]|nr:hypothetical protein [Gammaproteobacteria bacterium]
GADRKLSQLASGEMRQQRLPNPQSRHSYLACWAGSVRPRPRYLNWLKSASAPTGAESNSLLCALRPVASQTVRVVESTLVPE